MINIAKARKILGSKYQHLEEETIYDLLGFMIMLAKIDYINNQK
jgi:hypothetical protein